MPQLSPTGEFAVLHVGGAEGVPAAVVEHHGILYGTVQPVYGVYDGAIFKLDLRN